MDTRSKIVTLEQARSTLNALQAEGTRVKLLFGYFDVLQPDLVTQLSELADPDARLIAVVLEPEMSLLSASARRELAASLRVIDFVIPMDDSVSGPSLEFLLSATDGVETIHLESVHGAISLRLIEHVWERHGRRFERRSRH